MTLTLKERVAEKQEQFNRNSLETFNDPERLKRWLKHQLNFYQYSPLNRLMIYTQNPEARYVQSYKKWKDMGHPVTKKGALKIFCPNYAKMIEILDGKTGKKQTIFFDKATEEEKEKAIRTYKKQFGFTLASVFDISCTDATEEDLVKLTKESQKKCKLEDLSDIYQQLSDYCEIVSDADTETGKIYEVVSAYIRERLLKEYPDFEYIDVLTEADTYCVLSDITNIDQTLLSYKTLNSVHWTEDKLDIVRKLNQYICESSVTFIEDIARAF